MSDYPIRTGIGEDDKELVLNLERIALENQCYIKGVAIGLIVGAATRSPLLVLVGGLVGLLGAAVICRPISETEKGFSFIKKSELDNFRNAISAHQPVTTEEAEALAVFASKAAGVAPMTPGPEFKKQLGEFLKAVRSASL